MVQFNANIIFITNISFDTLRLSDAYIGSDNGLLPGRRQAIIWTSDGILLIGPLGTNFSEILIKIYLFSFNKMHLKMSPGKWRPFCLSLNVLKQKPHKIEHIYMLYCTHLPIEYVVLGEGTNFSEILIKIYLFSFNKMHLKMSPGKWRPFCLSLNVLKQKTHKIEHIYMLYCTHLPIEYVVLGELDGHRSCWGMPW